MLNKLLPTMATISRPLKILLFLSFLCVSLPAYALAIKKDVDPKLQDRAVYAVVNDFTYEIRKGNLSKAYQSFTNRDFRTNTTINQFTAFVSKFAALRRNRSIELIEVNYHDNVAVMKVTLMSLEHESNTAKIYLRYDEGRWRILSMQVFPLQR